MSKPGAENQKSGIDVDRGQMEQRAARSAALAALEEPRKRGLDRIFDAVPARPRPYFGPGFAPGPPFPWCLYITPWGSVLRNMQSLG